MLADGFAPYLEVSRSEETAEDDPTTEKLKKGIHPNVGEHQAQQLSQPASQRDFPLPLCFLTVSPPLSFSTIPLTQTDNYGRRFCSANSCSPGSTRSPAAASTPRPSTRN